MRQPLSAMHGIQLITLLFVCCVIVQIRTVLRQILSTSIFIFTKYSYIGIINKLIRARVIDNLMDIEYFGNDKYKVLSCMGKRQISVMDCLIVKLSQQEIADIVQLSKVKVNGIITELKKDGYITQKSPRGKYSLTDKANQTLSLIQGNEER
jgi:biotin operon repressor